MVGTRPELWLPQRKTGPCPIPRLPPLSLSGRVCGVGGSYAQGTNPYG